MCYIFLIACFLYQLTLKTCEAAFSHDMRCHAHGHVFAVNVEDLSGKTVTVLKERPLDKREIRKMFLKVSKTGSCVESCC